MDVTTGMTLPGQGIMLQVLDIERPENKHTRANCKFIKNIFFDIPIPLLDLSNSKFNFKSETCTQI